jgi:hypothetical protein
MIDREQDQRERAYRIWENEGRPEGRHAEHWQQAEDEDAAADATEANVEASEAFNDRKSGQMDEIRPPSTVAQD